MGLALEEQEREDDIVVETNGIKVIYTKELDGHVSTKALDYEESWFNKGFRFTGSGVSSC